MSVTRAITADWLNRALVQKPTVPSQHEPQLSSAHRVCERVFVYTVQHGTCRKPGLLISMLDHLSFA